MKKHFKKILLAIVVIVALFFGYKHFFTETEVTPEFKEEIIVVSTGSIKDSITAVGNAVLVDEQNLFFRIAGTVSRVAVRAGDEVRKGDVIAELDNKDALNSIKDAELSLENARISLQELFKSPDQSKILQARNNITQSTESLAVSEKELVNLKVSQENARTKASQDTENARKDLETARANLEILVREKDQNLGNTVSTKNTTIRNVEDSFRTYLIEMDRINTDADYILGVTDQNARKNDDFEIYLSARNPQFRNEASTLLIQSILNINALRDVVANYDFSGDRSTIIDILEQFLAGYEGIFQMTDALYRVAENSIESVGRLSAADIESIKTNAGTNRATAQTRVNSINSTINTLNTLSDTDLIANTNENAIASQELVISRQETAIENLIKTYNELLSSQKVALTNKENDVENKRKTLDIAKITYDELVKGPTSENVSRANNNIRQAEIRLDNARKNLDDYILTAPFDGIVRKIDYMVGDNLRNDTNKYVYLENPNLVEITVRLDQIDIVNVAVGNNAIITFDTYQRNPVAANISLIDTTPISTSGVISYQIKLIISDESFDKKILSGMTANVEIITRSVEDVIVLRNGAIKNMNGKNVVTIDEDGVRREVEVETGMSANGMTEIVSGLNVGDKVVIQTRIFNVNTDLTPMMQQMQENRQQNRQFEQSMGGGPQGGTIMIRN